MGTHQDQEGVESQQDMRCEGVPVYSLYGQDAASLRPAREMLESHREQEPEA